MASGCFRDKTLGRHKILFLYLRRANECCVVSVPLGLSVRRGKIIVEDASSAVKADIYMTLAYAKTSAQVPIGTIKKAATA